MQHFWTPVLSGKLASKFSYFSNNKNKLQRMLLNTLLKHSGDTSIYVYKFNLFGSEER